MNAVRSEEDLVIHPPSDRKALEWITALAAEGLEYRLTREGSAWQLVAPAAQSARSWAAIAAYEQANIGWPPKPARRVNAQSFGPSPWATLWGAGFIVLVFVCFGPYAGGNPWLRAAAADSTAIAAGQWWRPITALTLHAGFTHLASNTLFLAILGGFVCRNLGVGLGWALILASGIAGNLLTALLAQEPRLGIGASTACFGALGILAMCQSLENYRQFGDWKSIWSRVWVPLCAGLAMLGLLGSDPASDVVAHGFGFISGMAIVLPLGAVRASPPPDWVQNLLKLTVVILIMLAWRAAIRFAT